MFLKLRDFRKANGFEVKDMCRKLGVADSRYRKWESGVNGLPLDYALMCCDLFRCSLDELAGRETPVLSADERDLLSLYRACTPQGREYLLGVADVTARLFPLES